MSRSRVLGFAAAVGMLVVITAALDPAVGAPQRFRGRPLPVRMREGDVPKFDGNPPKHTGEYPAFNLVWQTDQRVRDAQAVYPHPIISGRVVTGTAAGLVISDDAGRSWKDVPGTAPAAIGRVRHVEFSIDEPGTCYIASDKGVWRTADSAKAPARVGSKQNGLADDNVAQVRMDGSDPLYQTLVAVHGPDVAGMSRSEDGGRTWKRLANLNEFFIEKVLVGGPGVPWALILARAKDPGNPRGVYFCRTVSDYPKEYAADVDVADGALELLCGNPSGEIDDVSYWATAGAGLLRVARGGTGADKLGPDDARWTSVGVTFGATADERIIFGLQPAKLGLGVSADDGKTFSAFSKGLPTGRFVKEGAQVRSSAGGGVFYATINNTLYVGRRYTGAFAITEASASPAVLNCAPAAYTQAFGRFRQELTSFRDQRSGPTTAQAVVEKYRTVTQTVSQATVGVTARITREGAGDAPPGTAPATAEADVPAEMPAQVTVDLSRVGGAARTLMYDDGLHNDGAAGDGVYGAVCLFRPDRLNNHPYDLRRPWPGPMGLTITAISEDDKQSSAVAVVGLLVRRESHAFWAPTEREKWRDLDGGLTTAIEDYGGPAFPDEIGAPPAERKAIKLITAGQAWSIPFSNYYDRSALGYESLSFFIRTDGPALREGDGDLYVQLRDSSPDTVSAATVRVPVLKNKLVEGGTIDGTYRRVVVPMAQLLAAPASGAAGTDADAAAFRPTLLKSVILSGDGKAAAKQSYTLSEIRLHVPDAKSPGTGGSR